MQSLSRKHYTRPYMEIRKSSFPDAGYGVFATYSRYLSRRRNDL